MVKELMLNYLFFCHESAIPAQVLRVVKAIKRESSLGSLRLSKSKQKGIFGTLRFCFLLGVHINIISGKLQKKKHYLSLTKVIAVFLQN